MTRFHGALLFAAVCLLMAVPAAGQIVGNPIEASGHVGYFKPDDRARKTEGPAFGGSVGYRFLPWMTLEGHALFAPSDQDSAPSGAHNFTYAGVDAKFFLTPPENAVVPFVLLGAGYGLSHTTGTEAEKLERGAASIGLGALWNIRDQRTFVRLQVRDIMFRERGLPEFSNHLSVNLGLQYNWGGQVKDSDLDGVRDRLDRCPETPYGARVDAHGCPIDTDKDGVFDGLDRCDDSIPGCVVDADGCAVDSDGDGVCDGLDQCADTPAGARVNATGCPEDSDNDGVLAGIDACPDTPQGCTVDETGCPTDADGDGVCDGLDQCPYTPAGAAVNERGCPYVLDDVERGLLETGRVRISNVNFASARGDLQPEIFPLLERLAVIMPQYPDLQFELAGFTDDRGDSAAADRMSLARANAVQTWFGRNAANFANVKLTVNGYGADGVGDRARYVELRILNTGDVRAELAKRTPPAGGAPPDTTGDGAGGDGSDE